MTKYEITWFDFNDSSNGTPRIELFEANYMDEAIDAFKAKYPGCVPWSIDF